MRLKLPNDPGISKYLTDGIKDIVDRLLFSIEDYIQNGNIECYENLMEDLDEWRSELLEITQGGSSSELGLIKGAIEDLESYSNELVQLCEQYDSEMDSLEEEKDNEMKELKNSHSDELEILEEEVSELKDRVSELEEELKDSISEYTYLENLYTNLMNNT